MTTSSQQFPGDRSSPFSLQEMGAIEDILQEVYQERKRQQLKWGRQDHPDGTGPGENSHLADDIASVYEYGELAGIFTELTDDHAEYGTLTYADILLEEVFEAMAESDKTKLRYELVQSGAVIVAWIEKLDRELS